MRKFILGIFTAFAVTSIVVYAASFSTDKLCLIEGVDKVCVISGSISGDVDFTLPVDDGDSGEVLTTDGSGVLSWSGTLVNPMDSDGDLIVGGASGAATKLDSGSDGEYLISKGAAAPAWESRGFYGSVLSVNASLCQWSGTSSSYANFAADSDCDTATASGNASAPATKVPGIRFSSGLEVGFYQVLVEGAFIANKGSDSDATCEFRLTDGTSGFGYVQLNGNAFDRGGPLVGFLNVPSATGDVTIQVQHDLQTGGTRSCQISNDSNNEIFRITVIKF